MKTWKYCSFFIGISLSRSRSHYKTVTILLKKTSNAEDQLRRQNFFYRVGLVVLIWGFNVCNALLPCFSQVWAVSISITLFLHLHLHLSDHLLHSPQLRNTQTVSHTDLHTQTFVLLVFGLRDHTSASFSSKIISLSISSGSGAFLHDKSGVKRRTHICAVHWYVINSHLWHTQAAQLLSPVVKTKLSIV